jgi:hypothetical protein
MLKTFILGLVVMMLTACSTTQATKVVEQPTITTFSIDAALLEPSTTTAPPDRDVYLKASPKEREALLTTYINQLLKDVHNRDIKLEEIRKLNDKYQQIVKDYEKRKAEYEQSSRN